MILAWACPLNDNTHRGTWRIGRAPGCLVSHALIMSGLKFNDSSIVTRTPVDPVLYIASCKVVKCNVSSYRFN